MGQADTLIAIEKGQVGYRENNGSSNHNNLQRFSAEVPGLEWSQYQAWCMTFQCWGLLKAGLQSLGPTTASTATGYQWYVARGRASQYPAIGALVFFGPGAGSHVGLVWKYDANTIWTIEGNTNDNGSAEGDGVYLKTRGRRDSYTYGYGYPAFAEGIVTADPAHPVAGSIYRATASSGAAASTPPPPATNLPQVSYAQVNWAARAAVADEKRVKAGPDNPQDDVTKVQAALVKKGFLKAGNYTPGLFTNTSTDAYKQWQKSLGYSGVDADGIPGPDSLKKLGAGLFTVTQTDVTYKPVFNPVAPPPPVVKPPPPAPQPTAPAWISYAQVVWAANSTDAAERAQQPGPANSTDDVAAVQAALVKVLGKLEPGAANGYYDAATQATYKKWQEKLGYTGSDADGVPGQDSLVKLGEQSKVFNVRDFPADLVSTAGAISPNSVTYARHTANWTASGAIKAACAANGILYNNYWEAGYQHAMTNESGGNANACNLYDLNAVTPAGYSQVHDYGDGYYSNGSVRPLNGALTPFQCSRGPWQCIPQTFATYHVAGTSVNIYDPVASAAASMRYVMKVYGVQADGSNLWSKVQQFNPGSNTPKGY